MNADLKDGIGGVARDIYLRANPAALGRSKCYVQLRARPRCHNDGQTQAREAETGVIDGDRRNRRAGLSGIVKVTDGVSVCATATDANLKFTGELRSCSGVRACSGNVAPISRRKRAEKTRKLNRELRLDWGSRMPLSVKFSAKVAKMPIGHATSPGRDAQAGRCRAFRREEPGKVLITENCR